MKVLCGTDFSSRTAEAADVAAGLAARFGTNVHLVHAFETVMRRSKRPVLVIRE